MKLILRLQLLPDAETADRLRSTMERHNEATNWITGELFAQQISNKVAAQRLLYLEVRARFKLSAQATILCIHRACEALKRDLSICPTFRPLAAIAYDQRVMSFKANDRVSLLTLQGRVVVPFLMWQHQRDRFALRKGQADLVLREDGKWFLLVTVEVPEEEPIAVTDFLGVDLGIVQLATDSDGTAYSGKPVEDVRKKHNLQRKRLQRRNTKGAKKKLKRIAGKEARFRRHKNHCISKKIVQSAKRTGRGIVLEDLKHIRGRVTARGGEARNRLGGWGFAQLGAFIGYKACLGGVPVVLVNPRNTSRTCPECGYCDKGNRKSQSEFKCLQCAHSQNADWIAARNIRLLALGATKPPTELAGVQPSRKSPA